MNILILYFSIYFGLSVYISEYPQTRDQIEKAHSYLVLRMWPQTLFQKGKSLKKKKKEFQTDKYMKKKPNPNHKNVKYASIHYRGIPISVSISILGFYSLNRKLDWKI